MARKLEITLHLPNPRFTVDLPDDWDEMTPDEQQLTIDNEVDNIIWNHVSGTGRVTEAK